MPIGGLRELVLFGTVCQGLEEMEIVAVGKVSAPLDIVITMTHILLHGFRSVHDMVDLILIGTFHDTL